MKNQPPDYLTEAPISEVNDYYRAHVPNAYPDGIERFQEGQEFGLCPDEALATPPIAIIQTLVDVNEAPERVIHSLRVAERAAKATDAPIDLALWCGWEFPDYEDIGWRYSVRPKPLRAYHPNYPLEKDFGSEVSEVWAQAWENEIEKAHSANYLKYERLIESVRAAGIDHNFLRIRPALVAEHYHTPLTTKRQHSDEAIMDDAAARDLSPDLALIRLDCDTTFVGKQTLNDLITHVQKGEKPIVKARMVYTSEPNATPIAQRKQSERLAAVFAVAQCMAEQDTFQNGGKLPYLDEVGTALSLRTIGRSLGLTTPNPKIVGESRALLYNLQDNLGISAKDAVQFLSNSRLGTSDRKIVQDIEQWLARPERRKFRAILPPDQLAYTHYNSAVEHQRNTHELETGSSPKFKSIIDQLSRESAGSLTREDILAISDDAIVSYRKEFSEKQINRLVRLAGRLGLIGELESEAS